MIGQILKEAWISMTAYKMRTFLTVLGIMIEWRPWCNGGGRSNRSK